MSKRLLSFLEVEGLDGEGKDKGEKHAEADDSNRAYTQEVMSESIELSYKILHSNIVTIRHSGLDIAILRSYKSIECPCNRTYPHIPSPPDRNPLWSSIKVEFMRD